MMRFSLMLATLLMSATAATAATEVNFETGDGITVYGDLYAAAAGKSAPIVLLFHQAGGDARGEYAQIAERLADTGYNVLAIDQRNGGDRFGGVNRTLAALGGKEYSYCEVYPDLQAALDYVRSEGYDGSLAVWGSSYSAALVFQLGAKNQDQVHAILGFSPASGGPMADCEPGQYLDALFIPALALRPKREAEIESVQRQLALFEASGVRTYIADPGVHGSSMLVAERVAGPTDKTWMVVLDFLQMQLRRH